MILKFYAQSPDGQKRAWVCEHEDDFVAFCETETDDPKCKIFSFEDEAIQNAIYELDRFVSWERFRYGDRVRVFQQPYLDREFENEATIVTKYNLLKTHEINYAYYIVRFDDGHECVRVVHPRNKIRKDTK